MTTEEYWAERGRWKLELGDKTAVQIERECGKLYADTLAAIEKEIEAFYGRYAKKNGLTVSEVRKRLSPDELGKVRRELKRYYDIVDRLARNGKGDVDVDRLLKYKEQIRAQSARAYMSRLEELRNALKHQLFMLGAGQDDIYTERLVELCGEAIDRALYDIDASRGWSRGYVAVERGDIRELVGERWLGENYSDRIWADKARLVESLETVFMQGVARGQNPNKIAAAMSKKYGTSYKNNARLCRTETAHIVESATMYRYKTTGVKEIRFVATLDSRACELCGSLDGEHYPRTSAMIGVNYPPMHPMCRCTTVAHFADDDGGRVARANGEWVEVPSTMTYNEWRAKVGAE